MPVKAKMAAENETQRICSENASQSESLSAIEGVDIDIGRFKYVLIQLVDKSCRPKAKKYIVRGYKWASFHADVYEKIEEDLAKKYPDIKCSCPGGGRIIHEPDAKKISVFGYSQCGNCWALIVRVVQMCQLFVGYGKPDHSISVAVLKEKFPDYTIDCSDDGY